MEKTMTLNLRVNPTVKQQAEDVLKQLGIPMADSKDSMAPSTAIVMATGNKFFIASQSKAGITASGSSARMLKRSPVDSGNQLYRNRASSYRARH